MCFEISSAPSAEPLSWTRVAEASDGLIRLRPVTFRYKKGIRLRFQAGSVWVDR